MSLFCYDRDCTGIAFTASLVIAIIVAFLRITAVITVPAVFLWVIFGIAVGYLALLVAVAATREDYRKNRCICSIIKVLLLSIIVAIITSVILLAVTFVATSIIGAIITGILIGSFALIFFESACLVKCLVKCDFDD